ncbi:MAG: hypothetical protein PHV37_00155 [Candidatus Gastranaerophilales bacterium]|nr:hypothetical protein [Candidatus Gastranaerophilales bacterium]
MTIISIILGGVISPAFAAEKKLVTEEELNSYQTRTYDVQNPQIVMEAVKNIIVKQNYSPLLIEEDLYYIKATKSLTARDVNMFLVVGFLGKMGFDIFQTIVTYGLRSYCVVSDVWIVANEFKDKELKVILSVNVTPKNGKTIVRADMQTDMLGQRDMVLLRLLTGKKNRIKIIHVKDETAYKIFFARLDKELGANQNLTEVSEKIVK